MADTSNASPLPPLTRLGRASALLAGQGAAVGFAIDTLRLWSRLPDFVATNKMSTSERASLLVWMFLPALACVAAALGFAWARRTGSRRLSFVETWAQRGSCLIALGMLPILLHPILWRSRGLMFLLATGMAAVAAWWAIRLTQQGFQPRSARAVEGSDLDRMRSYLDIAIPMKLRSVAPVLVIGILILYILLRGVWLDPTAVPAPFGEPPVGVHSIRQGFRILGHGGWLSIAVASIKFLRPPSHAHVLVWAALISTAAFGLYAWARSYLGVGMALTLAIIYLAIPPLRTIGRAEVLPLGVAAGPFFFAIAAWERKNYRSAAWLTLLTIGIHEQAALWFACFGVYLSGHVASAKLGRWLAILGVAYFAVIAFYVLPACDLDPYRKDFRGLWGTDAVGLAETLRVAVTNPPFLLSRWLDRQGLEFWLVLFVPFAFIPLTSKNWLLWALPGALFVVVALGRIPGLPIAAGAAAHFIVLGLVASVTTLGSLRRDLQTRARAHAALLAWIFAVVPCACQLGSLAISAP